MQTGGIFETAVSALAVHQNLYFDCSERLLASYF